MKKYKLAKNVLSGNFVYLRGDKLCKTTPRTQKILGIYYAEHTESRKMYDMNGKIVTIAVGIPEGVQFYGVANLPRAGIDGHKSNK